MTNDLDRDLREMFMRHEPDLAGRGTPPKNIVGRVRRRQARTALVVVVAAIALTVVGISGLEAIGTSKETPASTGPPVSPKLEADYVLDLNTGAKTPLPDSIIRSIGGTRPGDYRLWRSWYAVSPDGSRLAYMGIGDSGNAQIFIANIDGSEVQQVTHDPGGAKEPAWSPDGTKIAYVASNKGPSLILLDLATGESVRLDLGVEGGTQVTPDGSIVYTAWGDMHTELRTVPTTGGESRRLVGWFPSLSNGSISPDGSHVAFIGEKYRDPVLWVAPIDGTPKSERHGIPACTPIPAGTWSPDGSRIVCSRDGEVLVADVATGAATTVASGAAAIWLDDHTLLVEARI